jgi:predicted nucleic acid-binding protein
LTAAPAATTLYLDQNYLSGLAKRKPAFAELEPVLRAAIANGVITVLESKVHEQESAPRPDLKLLELLRELSQGHKLPDSDDRASRETRRRLERTIAYELPERRARPSDRADLDALAQALTHCDLVTCDAFMADVIKRARLNLRHQVELFSGRRRDVIRLRDRIQAV